MSKTALITGAANGIGHELAKILIRDSYDLILIDKDRDKLEEIKQRWENESDQTVKIIPKNLSFPGAAHEIFKEVKSWNIPVDVLINNAGFGTFGLFTETDWERETEMINLHVLATTQLTKLFLKEMIKRNYGNIMNTSSLAAFLPGPLMAVYYASKAYLLSFTQAIANEVKGTGVSITVLCPGLTKTNFQKTVGGDKAKIKWTWTTPDKVAQYGYKAMQKGKVVAIPGFVNLTVAKLSRIVPGSISAKIVRRFIEMNRKKLCHIPIKNK